MLFSTIIKMAKTNQVSIYAAVMKPARVDTNRTRATAAVMIMRGDRDSGDPNTQPRRDYPMIASKDPKIVADMANWEENDIVLIKGVLVTKTVQYVSICERCGAQNQSTGMLTYIEPIHVMTIKHTNSQEEAIDEIYRNREISNEMRIVGTLCNDPIEKKLSRTTLCTYQLAVPRTYRIKGSTDEEKIDFPFIKSYGKNAKEDVKRIKSGSLVLIDGYLQTRTIKNEIECNYELADGSICGNKYFSKNSLMEVVPFEIEYLRNYVTDEDLGIEKDFVDAFKEIEDE